MGADYCHLLATHCLEQGAQRLPLCQVQRAAGDGARRLALRLACARRAPSCTPYTVGVVLRNGEIPLVELPARCSADRAVIRAGDASDPGLVDVAEPSPTGTGGARRDVGRPIVTDTYPQLKKVWVGGCPWI